MAAASERQYWPGNKKQDALCTRKMWQRMLIIQTTFYWPKDRMRRIRMTQSHQTQVLKFFIWWYAGVSSLILSGQVSTGALHISSYSSLVHILTLHSVLLKVSTVVDINRYFIILSHKTLKKGPVSKNAPDRDVWMMIWRCQIVMMWFRTGVQIVGF